MFNNFSFCKYLFFKRVFDLSVAFLLILVFMPFFTLAWLLVLLSLGRPVIFAQVRPGKDGKSFCVYKFRTMNASVNQCGDLLPDAERLTKIGRFIRKYSIDELPQLFCVLKGDMSLVGPRPLLPEYLSLYNTEEARRHDVRPGITGWAQVNGRNAITWEEKFKYDVFYVDNISFLLDCKILYLTILQVLKSEGVSASGHATMPKFVGSQDEKQ